MIYQQECYSDLSYVFSSVSSKRNKACCYSVFHVIYSLIDIKIIIINKSQDNCITVNEQCHCIIVFSDYKTLFFVKAVFAGVYCGNPGSLGVIKGGVKV